MTRVGSSAVGALVLILGALGLWRASAPESGASGAPPSQTIVISKAYVRPPLPPTHNAAAYFTVTNLSGKADKLLSVDSGAGATTVLHASVDGQMEDATDGVVIPAHGSLVLSAGQGHVMIEGVYGTLSKGDNVNLVLTFANAGTLNIDAPVIGATQQAP